MQFGTRGFFAWMPAPDERTIWFANPPMAPEPERGVLSGMADAQWRRRLHDLMDGDVGPSHEIIDARTWAADRLGHLRHACRAPLAQWSEHDHYRGRRHGTAPSAGQGASMALEDAVMLAKCLRDCPSAPAAFATFEALHRDRVERIVKHGARSANS
jgi:FAD-dependent urate hydroxylase